MNQIVNRPVAAIAFLTMGAVIMLRSGILVAISWPDIAGGQVRGDEDFGLGWLWPGVVAGCIALIGVALMYFWPALSTTWGVIVATVTGICIILGINEMEGGISALIGGALAIGWKPQITNSSGGIG